MTDGTPESDRTTRWIDDNIHTAKLSDSLPRVLEFAKRGGYAALERWVRLELYGYNEQGGMTADDEVPEYRAVAGRWMDQFNRALDISEHPDLSFINEYRFRFGVAKLEDLASRQDMQNIADEQLMRSLRKNMGVEVIRFCFSPIEISAVLDTIRNRLAEMVADCRSSSDTERPDTSLTP